MLLDSFACILYTLTMMFASIAEEKSPKPQHHGKSKDNIIAIMGVPGSGKKEVIEYLMAVYRIPKFSFRTVLEEEIIRSQIPIGYVGSRAIRKRLEEQLGSEYVPTQIALRIDEDVTHENALVEGLELEGRRDYEVLRGHYGQRLRVITIHLPIYNIFRSFLQDVRQVTRLADGGPMIASDHMLVNDGNITKLMRAIDSIMAGYGIIKP